LKIPAQASSFRPSIGHTQIFHPFVTILHCVGHVTLFLFYELETKDSKFFIVYTNKISHIGEEEEIGCKSGTNF
jgi:hypothetical protein